MTYQEREKFANWLLDRYLRDDTIDGIMAEYDRLTDKLEQECAINTQLLEACRHYLINPQSPMVHDEIEAAIRAAEEYQA